MKNHTRKIMVVFVCLLAANLSSTVQAKDAPSFEIKAKAKPADDTSTQELEGSKVLFINAEDFAAREGAPGQGCTLSTITPASHYISNDGITPCLAYGTVPLPAGAEIKRITTYFNLSQTKYDFSCGFMTRLAYDEDAPDSTKGISAASSVFTELNTTGYQNHAGTANYMQQITGTLLEGDDPVITVDFSGSKKDECQFFRARVEYDN